MFRSKTTANPIFNIEKDFAVVVKTSGELEAKKSHIIPTPRIYPRPSISVLAPEGAKVKKGEMVVRFESEKLERDLLNALDQLETAKAEAQKKEAELNLQRLMYESQIKTAEASLESIQLQVTKLEFEAPRIQEMKRLEIERQTLEAKRAKKKLTALQKVQAEERAHYQLKIKQAESKINRAKMQLEQLILRSPSDGIFVHGTNIITGEKVKEGEALFFGMPVANIPDLSLMQAKFQVGESEAQKIKRGQHAEIIIPVLGNHRFLGKVTRKANIAKPIKRGSKVKKVEVIVELDSTQEDLVPGLSAKGNIIIQKVDSTIAVPHECVFENDSIKVVYEQKSKSFIPHAVAIYEQDENFAVIISDLKGGEDLALIEPNESLVLWPDSLVTPLLPERPKEEVKTVPKDSLTLDEMKKRCWK